MEKTHVRQLHLSMSCSATGCEFDVNESNHIRCTLNKVFSTETHARHSLVKATGKVWMQHSGSTQERRMDSTRRAEGGIVEGWLMSWDLKKKKKIETQWMNQDGRSFKADWNHVQSKGNLKKPDMFNDWKSDSSQIFSVTGSKTSTCRICRHYQVSLHGLDCDFSQQGSVRYVSCENWLNIHNQIHYAPSEAWAMFP